MLKIASNLSLPKDTVTSTLILFGGKGMGKTNLLAVLAEELAANGHRFCLIDPVGRSWGLRYSADGKGSGIELLILGGRHGDIPIEPTGGAVVADLVVDEDVNVLIDIHSRQDGKSWSRGERIRFVTEYFTRLYERQGENRRPLMQIVDEAARFVPQTIRAGDKDIAACSGAVDTVVEEGRNVGIGVTLVAQRSARMSKAVTELADCMIAFRTVGPNSVDAIIDWFGEHVPKERWKGYVEELRKLPRGTALVVSPGWLEFEGKVGIRMRHTFDSSATPKAGRERRTSGQGARPDLSRYLERMAATIEKAKAEDPRELQKQVIELKKRLAQAETAAFKQAVAAPLAPEALKREFERGAQSVKVALAKELRAYIRGAEELVKLSVSSMNHARATIGGAMEKIVSGMTETDAGIKIPPMPSLDAIIEQVKAEPAPIARPLAAPTPRPVRQPQVEATGDGAVGNSGLRRMLIALAQRNGLSAKQVGVRAGMSSKSGTFGTYLGRARTNGWVNGSSQQLEITAAGLKALGSYDPLPVGAELLEYWVGELGNSGAARMLRALADHYPKPMTAEELGEATAMSAGSGTFGTYLGRLRSLELIHGSKDELRASDELFDDAESARG